MHDHGPSPSSLHIKAMLRENLAPVGRVLAPWPHDYGTAGGFGDYAAAATPPMRMVRRRTATVASAYLSRLPEVSQGWRQNLGDAAFSVGSPARPLDMEVAVRGSPSFFITTLWNPGWPGSHDVAPRVHDLWHPTRG